MYDLNRGSKLRANILKTIRLDRRTFQFINTYRGSNFSERLRNLVYDFEKCKTKLLQ